MIEEAVALYESGHSIPQVAEALGRPKSTVRLILLRAGVKLRTVSEALAVAFAQGRVRRVGNRSPRSSSMRERVRQARLRHSALHAAGTCLTSRGYVRFTKGPHCNQLVHRVLMEERLGRRLRREEHVHHKDGNRKNNEIENLEVLHIAEHARLHRLNEAPRSRKSNGRFS